MFESIVSKIIAVIRATGSAVRAFNPHPWLASFAMLAIVMVW